MKIIDLFNKIANGEEVPNSFKYKDLIFKRHNDCGTAYYKDNDGDTFLDSICGNLSNLNDEVEILEEEKKIPEKLPLIGNKIVNYPDDEFIEKLFNLFYQFEEEKRSKINEIIDYLESKNKGDE